MYMTLDVTFYARHRSDEMSCSSSLASLNSMHTPRSERESEDAAAHYSALAKSLGEDNERLRERVKKERTKRAKVRVCEILILTEYSFVYNLSAVNLLPFLMS